DYGFEFGLRQCRVHRQREYLLRCRLGLRKVEIELERWKAVNGSRVVHATSNPLLSECRRECVAVMVDDPDRVLVINVNCAGRSRGSYDAFDVRVEECCILLALRGPAGELGKLNPTDCSVDICHARVEANYFVLISALHALVAEH